MQKTDCWRETCCGIGLKWLVAERAQAWYQGCGTSICGKGFGPFWIRGTACVLRTASTHWNVPGKYEPHGEPIFFLLKKEPMVLGELIEFGPFFSAGTTGLHMMAEEVALRSDRDSSPDLGEM